MPKETDRTKSAGVELEADAWIRFERFIRDIAKAGPQHRTQAKRTTSTRKPKKKEKR